MLCLARLLSVVYFMRDEALFMRASGDRSKPRYLEHIYTHSHARYMCNNWLPGMSNEIIDNGVNTKYIGLPYVTRQGYVVVMHGYYSSTGTLYYQPLLCNVA